MLFRLTHLIDQKIANILLPQRWFYSGISRVSGDLLALENGGYVQATCTALSSTL